MANGQQQGLIVIHTERGNGFVLAENKAGQIQAVPTPVERTLGSEVKEAMLGTGLLNIDALVAARVAQQKETHDAKPEVRFVNAVKGTITVNIAGKSPSGSAILANGGGIPEVWGGMVGDMLTAVIARGAQRAADRRNTVDAGGKRRGRKK